ncbi:MAG: tRNA glutamyl-Q(34) synthetase GluQRS [Geminicoccaceae bacterium]
MTFQAGETIIGGDFLPLPHAGAPANVTRFAPSPTGYLHLGHAYSALIAHDSARCCGGRFILRIEDIDPGRCRQAFVDGIIEDLTWLGLTWDGPIRQQSDHYPFYASALEELDKLGVLYRCFCTRKQIQDEVAQAGAAPHGPSGEVVYPGTCRHLAASDIEQRLADGVAFAWRLDVTKAAQLVGALSWHDVRRGDVVCDVSGFGDVVLARKDAPTSYHLAVTLDDWSQGITLVTRGEDLFHATHIHRLLQALLGLTTPRYYHHNLIADSQGRRMAKRNRATTIRSQRHMNRTPAQVWDLLGLPAPTPVA